MRSFLWAVLALVLIITAWTSVTQVEAGQRGVVRRFGRVIEVANPGLYIGLPWGIDQVELVAVDRLRRVIVGYTESDTEDVGPATPPGQLLTGDHNLVNVKVVLDYAVDDTQVERFVLYGDQADGLVARAAESVLAEWIASRPVDDVLLTGRALLPAYLVEETQKRLAAYKLGVQIKLANVDHLFAPREVKAAFDDVTRAQAEIQTLVSEAEQEANRLVGDALTEKFDLEKMAAARAGEILALADAQAKSFEKSLEVYRLLRANNPNYLAMLWWDEMSRLYARMRQNGRIELLDHWLGGDGIDILQMPQMPKR